jgi:hypothetical protein
MLASPGALEAAVMPSIEATGSDDLPEPVETALEVVLREGGCPEIATLLVQAGAALGEMASPAAAARLDAMVGPSAALSASGGIVAATGLAGIKPRPGSHRLDWAVGFAGHSSALRAARLFVARCMGHRRSARGLAGVAILEGDGAAGPAGTNLARRVATGLGAEIVHVDTDSAVEIETAASRIAGLRQGDAAAIICRVPAARDAAAAAAAAEDRPGHGSGLVSRTLRALEAVLGAGHARGIAVYVLVAVPGPSRGSVVPPTFANTADRPTIVASLRFTDPSERDREELALAEIAALRAAVYKRTSTSGHHQGMC